MKYLTSSPGSSRFPEHKRTLGAKLDICQQMNTAEFTATRAGAQNIPSFWYQIIKFEVLAHGLKLLYWKGRIGNRKSETGIDDRGRVIGDR